MATTAYRVVRDHYVLKVVNGEDITRWLTEKELAKVEDRKVFILDVYGRTKMSLKYMYIVQWRCFIVYQKMLDCKSWYLLP